MNSSIRTPELPATLEWFNTPSPLRLIEQRGKMVLLDFWTYCCINCMHILPDLAYLEQKYPTSLTVIGIHSPKFPQERVGKQVQKAINRYHIHHPIAHDPLLAVWESYGIRAWPSFILIDAAGYVVASLSGEGRREQLDHLIAHYLAQAEQQGIRVTSAMPVQLAPEPNSPLKFPGKLYASADRLYLSDSGHHRILETNWVGQILRCFGNGHPGLMNGNPEQAQFDDPQGLIKLDNQLYVADTHNHALRRIDLTTGQVDTLAGTGQQGRHQSNSVKNPLQIALNSPWDLAYHEGILYIAMAGQHQIWAMNLVQPAIGVYAGSGREDIIDGQAHQSAFAQPSGLSIGDSILYVADAETSAVRRIHLPDAITDTLIGCGLFVFGDKAGIGTQARLQHPLAVAWDKSRQGIWIADTYNSKIKWFDINTHQVVDEDIHYPLNEPSGLSLYQDTLWIANTNAHQILRYDILDKQGIPIDIT
jgi:thiol-disulfide isomerase/thioredoxin